MVIALEPPSHALVGFQAFRPDGRYSFDDQPLNYGVKVCW